MICYIIEYCASYWLDCVIRAKHSPAAMCGDYTALSHRAPNKSRYEDIDSWAVCDAVQQRVPHSRLQFVCVHREWHVCAFARQCLCVASVLERSPSWQQNQRNHDGFSFEVQRTHIAHIVMSGHYPFVCFISRSRCSTVQHCTIIMPYI